LLQEHNAKEAELKISASKTKVMQRASTDVKRKTWSIMKIEERAPAATERAMERRMLGVPLDDHINNQTLRQMSGVQDNKLWPLENRIIILKKGSGRPTEIKMRNGRSQKVKTKGGVNLFDEEEILLALLTTVGQRVLANGNCEKVNDHLSDPDGMAHIHRISGGC
uniref:Reverse transcriptase domain-containing protein n=1 Tax=Gongylonema pulchrum TaxID=637853 RepID=A0A183EYQ1_9BILA